MYYVLRLLFLMYSLVNISVYLLNKMSESYLICGGTIYYTVISTCELSIL